MANSKPKSVSVSRDDAATSFGSLNRFPHAKLDPKLIAPCGMNCAICKAHLRKHNPCPGCNFAEKNRPKTRAQCPLRVCRKRTGRFCCTCPKFPCGRLLHLDQRYRTKYGMSQIENLKFIQAKGIKKFIEKETKRWFFSKGVLCVHDKKYYRCD